ncbi:pyrroloquinoline quinone biosynthesis protein PqqB [Streptomyces sp. NPDC050548]|uniref:pyrroloquinoline quinone biosynthesis protein PqqB n=1 Tax=Streptomyces sp. NPDC050548 TaxID=3365629 RepID=UPI0037AD7AD4
MRVVLLGTAAGGGFPQWNCACALCAAARDGKLPWRTEDSVAVTGNARDWWLLNASPDVRTQVAATSALSPGPGPRETPVRGVLLTDAEPHHVAGLTALCGAAGLKVYAPRPALAALTPARTVLDRYAPWEWADSLAEDGFVLAGGLVVTAHPVGEGPPEYVPPARRPDDRWTVAYRVEDLATGGAFVYAPRIGAWTAALDDLLETADCAVLDGTFFGADEVGMGQLSVTGPGGSLTALARHPGVRRIYTHLGNTNPLLDPGSTARAQVNGAGVEVLMDGAEFVV